MILTKFILASLVAQAPAVLQNRVEPTVLASTGRTFSLHGKKSQSASEILQAVSDSVVDQELPKGWPGCTKKTLAEWGESGWPRKLDVALYWFDQEGNHERASADAASSMYDPSKDTVIFFNGMKRNIESCFRMTPKCQEGSAECNEFGIDNAAAGWFDKGWNVGFFYWDQLADEDCWQDAETKLWTSKGPTGMRWHSYEGTGRAPKNLKKQYKPFENNDTSVTDMCVDILGNTMGEFQGKQLRFVGQALGAQLATSCGRRLKVMDHTAAPTSIVMLDPVFAKHREGRMRCSAFDIGLKTDSDNGGNIAGYTAKATKDLLLRNVPTIVYRSSLLSKGEDGNRLGALKLNVHRNAEIDPYALIVDSNADWCDDKYDSMFYFDKNTGCKHASSILSYFTSMDADVQLHFDAPKDVQENTCQVPTPQCSDHDLLMLLKAQRWMHLGGSKGQLWQQVGGMATATGNDDVFSVVAAK